MGILECADILGYSLCIEVEELHLILQRVDIQSMEAPQKYWR